MSYEIPDNESFKLDLLLGGRMQRIEEMKKRLREDITVDDENELLRNLSREMSELLRLQENYFRSL